MDVAVGRQGWTVDVAGGTRGCGWGGVDYGCGWV